MPRVLPRQLFRSSILSTFHPSFNHHLSQLFKVLPFNMGGPSRGPSKKAALRSAVPSQTSIVNPSSGTTVVDDTMTVPSTAATELGASYITPQGTQTEASSRLSQSLEPLISDAGGATSMVNSNEVSALGAGVSELISTMNELEKLGFSNLDISLAKCVVCGKSSLRHTAPYSLLVYRRSIGRQVIGNRSHFWYQGSSSCWYMHTLSNVHQARLSHGTWV